MSPGMSQFDAGALANSWLVPEPAAAPVKHTAKRPQTYLVLAAESRSSRQGPRRMPLIVACIVPQRCVCQRGSMWYAMLHAHLELAPCQLALDAPARAHTMPPFEPYTLTRLQLRSCQLCAITYAVAHQRPPRALKEGHLYSALLHRVRCNTSQSCASTDALLCIPRVIGLNCAQLWASARLTWTLRVLHALEATQLHTSC